MRVFLINRRVNTDYDLEPSVAHLFHFEISENLVKGKKVLDVGCWTGQYTALIARICEAVGVDISKEAIEFANKHHLGINFCLGSALSLPFKDNSFEVVTLWEVIEHLPEGKETDALLEIKRVLENGGKLLLSTPNNNIWSKIFDPAYFFLGHRHYSGKQLRELLIPLGFKIEKIYHTGGIFGVFYNNYELFWKHVLKRKAVSLKWLEEKVKNEFYKYSGFDSLYLIAKLVK